VTRAQLNTLRFLNTLTLPNWERVNYTIAKMLDGAIPYIGAVEITSTWRPAGSSKATNSYHSRGLVSYAIDFRPLHRPLWHVYLLLKNAGFKRIGISPAQNIIHIDSGVETHRDKAYYFAEDRTGGELGTLAEQAESWLRSIPGYNTSIPRGPIGYDPISAQPRANIGAALALVGAGAALFFFG